MTNDVHVSPLQITEYLLVYHVCSVVYVKVKLQELTSAPNATASAMPYVE